MLRLECALVDVVEYQLFNVPDEAKGPLGIKEDWIRYLFRFDFHSNRGVANLTNKR